MNSILDSSQDKSCPKNRREFHSERNSLVFECHSGRLACDEAAQKRGAPGFPRGKLAPRDFPRAKRIDTCSWLAGAGCVATVTAA